MGEVALHEEVEGVQVLLWVSSPAHVNSKPQPDTLNPTLAQLGSCDLAEVLNGSKFRMAFAARVDCMGVLGSGLRGHEDLGFRDGVLDIEQHTGLEYNNLGTEVPVPYDNAKFRMRASVLV